MSLYKSSSGRPITGSLQDAINSGFQLIPHGTYAKALIEEFTRVNDQFGERYQVKWKITEGPHKNRKMFQSLSVFDADQGREERAKNMMLWICRLCRYSPPSDRWPEPQELAVMHGKICTIKIDVYKDKNRIAEVHEQNYEIPADNFDITNHATKDSFKNYVAHSLPKGAGPVDIPDDINDAIPF